MCHIPELSRPRVVTICPVMRFSDASHNTVSRYWAGDYDTGIAACNLLLVVIVIVWLSNPSPCETLSPTSELLSSAPLSLLLLHDYHPCHSLTRLPATGPLRLESSPTMYVSSPHLLLLSSCNPSALASAFAVPRSCLPCTFRFCNVHSLGSPRAAHVPAHPVLSLNYSP